MNIEDLKEGNFILLNYGNERSDICKVKKIDLINENAIINIISTKKDIIINNPDKWDMFEPIPLREEYLLLLGFVKEDNYDVFKLSIHRAYVKYMPDSNDIIIKEEDGRFFLIIRNDNSIEGYDTNPILYLHILQNNIANYWNLIYDDLKFN